MSKKITPFFSFLDFHCVYLLYGSFSCFFMLVSYKPKRDKCSMCCFVDLGLSLQILTRRSFFAQIFSSYRFNVTFVILSVFIFVHFVHRSQYK